MSRLTFLAFFLVAALVDGAVSFLEQARNLDAPEASSTQEAEYEGSDFWESNADLLESAWEEWQGEVSQSGELPALNGRHIDPQLRFAIESAWSAADHARHHYNDNDEVAGILPMEQLLEEAENLIKGLWTQVAPGVFACQFLDPDKISDIRKHLKAADDSGIPTRRPNGMNRYGLILDSAIEGAVTMSGLVGFTDFLINDYIRQLGRLLFPEYISKNNDNDSESLAFTIRYKGGEDLYLKEHTDASLITLNVNLNPPDERYEGSNISFFADDDDAGEIIHNITFSSGMALLHRGMARHAAQSITLGERTNMVLWLFGADGYVRIAPYEEHERLTPTRRWTRPKKEDSKEEEQVVGIDEL